MPLKKGASWQVLLCLMLVTLEVFADIVDTRLFVVLESSVMLYVFFSGSSVDLFLRLLFWLFWSSACFERSCCWKCVFEVVIWRSRDRLLGVSLVDRWSPLIRCLEMIEPLWRERKAGGYVSMLLRWFLGWRHLVAFLSWRDGFYISIPIINVAVWSACLFWFRRWRKGARLWVCVFEVREGCKVYHCICIYSDDYTLSVQK